MSHYEGIKKKRKTERVMPSLPFSPLKDLAFWQREARTRRVKKTHRRTWRKNSSMTQVVHCLQIVHSFAGLLISAAIIVRRNDREK